MIAIAIMNAVIPKVIYPAGKTNSRTIMTKLEEKVRISPFG